MACCGDRRLTQRPHAAPAPRRAGAPAGRPARPESTLFEYTGQRSLVVTGPRTGSIYRFTAAGARLAAPSLAQVPGLRPVSSRIS